MYFTYWYTKAGNKHADSTNFR